MTCPECALEELGEADQKLVIKSGMCYACWADRAFYDALKKGKSSKEANKAATAILKGREDGKQAKGVRKQE